MPIIITALVSFIAGVFIFLFSPIFIRNTAFLAVLPVVCAGFIVALVHPVAVVYGILYLRVLLEPLLGMSRTNLGGLSIGLGSAFNLIVLLFALVMCFQYRHRLVKISFLKYWFVYLAITCVAVFYSPQPTFAFRMFLNFATYGAMGVIPFFLINSRQTRNKWLKHLVWAAILPVLAADVDLLRGGTVNWAGMRVMGTFAHPNILGFYLTFVIVLVFLVLKSKEFIFSRGMRTVLKCFLVNVFLLLLFTKTRNAWFACWFFFFIYGWIKERKYLFFCLALPPLLLLIPEFSYRIIELLQGDKALTDNPEQLNSWAWRVHLWKDAMAWIFKSPFWGYGFTSFKALSPKFSDFLGGIESGAHNVYVEILFETGFFGFLAYCAIYLNVIKRSLAGIKSKMASVSRESAILLAYLLSYLFVCIADNLQYYLALNWYVWFFIGCMLVPIEPPGAQKSIIAKDKILQ